MEAGDFHATPVEVAHERRVRRVACSLPEIIDAL